MISHTASASSFRSDADVLSRIGRLRKIAWMVDGAFRVPGTRLRFGLNAAIGLTPWVGDAVLIAVSAFIVWEARNLGLPGPKLAKMVKNVVIEAGLGAIPGIGDLLDVGFKANLRNIAILEEHFGIVDPATRDSFWRWPFARR